MSSRETGPHNEAKRVWAVAWPLIVTNILNASVGIIDFKMVGVLGVDSIAAVGMARQVMMFIMVLMIAVSGGASVLVAHAHGAGDRRRVSYVAGRSILLMALCAVFLIAPAGILLSRGILVLLGGKQTVVQLGTSYLRILFVGTLFTMFNFAVNGILLGVGRTRVSLALLILVNALNVAFNYLFIFGVGPLPAMGVAGAALGTVLARTVGSFAGVWILRTPRLPLQVEYRDALGLDVPLIRRILYLGGPRSLQGVVRNFSRLLTLRIITLLPDSTSAVSAYSVGMQVRMLSTFIGLAFMSAAMSRVGQNIGAGDIERAEKSGTIAARMATLLMSVAAILFLLFPREIMGFFTRDRHVIEMGMEFFLLIAVTEPLMAMAFALGGALRGAEDPISPFLYASTSDLAVVIGGGYLLAIVCNMGFTGIALAMALSSVTRALPTMWKFRKGDWKGAVQ